ncbi:MAG: DUF6125 family protein [Dehalococcoidia bacterium]|nr:DUF6125 family protein [Dehalococcoidia bacterium]MDD5493198.1 DUF6125 family protein [Dehalococcoidia bacterium]
MRVDTIPLEKRELRELLNKNWMTHDAMWFYNCLRECGIETANRLNQSAIRSMAAVEIKRIQKAVGIGKIETFADFCKLFDSAMTLATGDFMQYEYTYLAKNLVRSRWHKCFAYEGVKALGVIDRYECGVMLRIYTWLDTLGIKYEAEPQVTGCMMHTHGECYRDVKFFFDE